ncbi:MAG: hypothetical protein HY875_17520 [Chloroflexi bacterium]|nr:hypothetical protein [Chloroflexota bacterium]
MEDRAPGGRWAPGGPSLYSARTALALGAEVTLFTALTPWYDRAVLEGIELRTVAAEMCPRYANTYDASGDRTQLLLEEGPELKPAAMGLPPAADALIVAPAFHELAAIPGFRARFVAVSLQGALRSVAADRRVVPANDPIARAKPFAVEGAFLFLSEEDTADPDALAHFCMSRGATVFVTRGYRGATLYREGVETHLDPLPANPVDPTGAGDCFATAFIVRMAETGDLAASCQFALAAGAIATEAVGLDGVPTRAQVEDRLKVAAR